MIHLANELLAKLRLLTLAGFEDGELIWIGPTTRWKELTNEAESILRDFDLSDPDIIRKGAFTPVTLKTNG